MLKAVIDIGTNSTRLCIARVERAEGTVSVSQVRKYLTTTRLGQGSADGTLKREPMERTANAVVGFAAAAAEAGAQELYVYATAAVREAENRDAFSRMLLQNGVKLQLLSGEQEALIAFTGAANAEDTAVIDIGGGSTEVMVKHDGQVRAMSRKLGAVRLQERFGGSDGIDCRMLQRVKEAIAPELECYESIRPFDARTLVGVSGTATTLGAIKLGMREYSDAVQGTVLTLGQIRQLAEQLMQPLADRMLIPGVPQDRADIIPFGTIILESFMSRWGFDSLTVSDRDSLEGFLMLSEDPSFGAIPCRCGKN